MSTVSIIRVDHAKSLRAVPPSRQRATYSSKCVGAGPTFVQAAAQLAYWFNAHFGVHARVAYVTILDAEIREAIDENGGDAAKDFVWGNLGVEFAF